MIYLKKIRRRFPMALKLNQAAIAQAHKLIKHNEIETFDSNWNEEKPTPDEVNHYLDAHSIEEYGAWFLGINEKYPKHVKEHYDFPYGDLKTVQRSALVDTIKRAEQNGEKEIAQVAKKLLEEVDKKIKS
jgi:predicted Rossmann fold nucleotide-binding protein DprA/Smf involved in DNA uptake